MDANDSWGAPEPHGVFLTEEAAIASVCSNRDIWDLFNDVNFEGGYLNGVSEEVQQRVFGDKRFEDAYDAYEFLGDKDRSLQALANRVVNLQVQETEFHN